MLTILNASGFYYCITFICAGANTLFRFSFPAYNHSSGTGTCNLKSQGQTQIRCGFAFCIQWIQPILIPKLHLGVETEALC